MVARQQSRRSGAVDAGVLCDCEHTKGACFMQFSHSAYGDHRNSPVIPYLPSACRGTGSISRLQTLACILVNCDEAVHYSGDKKTPHARAARAVRSPVAMTMCVSSYGWQSQLTWSMTTNLPPWVRTPAHRFSVLDRRPSMYLVSVGRHRCVL